MADFTAYDETECIAVFDRLFPQGFSGDDVLNEIAADGWERSPMAAVFYPSLDQVYEECAQMHENGAIKGDAAEWHQNRFSSLPGKS